MTTAAAGLKTLELFNEKADQFLGSDFFNHIRGGGAIVEFNRDSGWDGIHVGPDEEATSALVLRLRFFMQDRDGTSVRKLGRLYRSLPVSRDVLAEYDAHRSQLNALLDSESMLAISDDGALTYRNVLDIFVYGEYAHVDARHRQTFEDLRTTPFFPLFQKALVDAIVAFARCISAIRDTNRRALQELTATES